MTIEVLTAIATLQLTCLLMVEACAYVRRRTSVQRGRLQLAVVSKTAISATLPPDVTTREAA
jgi:hypothetical protein